MQARPPRRKDIDRLRVLACISTFCYHPLTVFDLGMFSHIKSATTSAGFDVASKLLHTFRMPLFFLIAGMVALLSLKRHADMDVLKLRAWRLLLPLLVGVILFAPAIKYFELLDGRNISWKGVASISSAPEPLVFVRRFFTQPRWFSWSHLWFLAYLFVLGAALMPAMRRLRHAEWPARMPLSLALVIPLALLIGVELVLRPIFPWHIPNLIWDWANVCVYTIAMLAGAALIRFPDLEVLLQRRVAVFAAVTGIGVYMFLGFDDWMLSGIGRALTLWGVICLAIGLGPLLSRGAIFGEQYISDAVLPLYVLHLLPQVAIAFFVKDLDWPLWQRYGIIVLGGVAVTLVVYEFLVRRFDVMRLAFGLPRKSEVRRRT